MFRVITLVGSFLMAFKQLSGTAIEHENLPQSSVILSVERTLICAKNQESLEISCSLTVRNHMTDSINFWSLSWFTEEKRVLENTAETMINNSVLTSYLAVRVTWPRQKIFTCVGRRSRKHWSRRNDSQDMTLRKNIVVIVRMMPRVTTSRIVGLRFLENFPLNTIEVFWRPTVNSKTTVHTLKYCAENREEGLASTCSRHSLPKGQCQVRQRDYYNVGNTTGFICKSAISSAQMANVYTVYRLSVIVQDEAGCENVGVERRFQIALWRDPNANPNITEVVMVPYPVTKLHVVSTRRRTVRVTLSDPWFVMSANSRIYTVRYKCLKSVTWSRTETSRTTITLTYKNFDKYLPHDLCQFCVAGRPFENAIDSKPVCASIRLHEEVPVGAPRVTCSGNECESTSDGMKRNVTITWALPPREDWNGILTKVKVIYRVLDEAQRKHAEIFVSNVTTTGETILTGLAGNSSYVVQMVACNKEGCGNLGNGTKIPALSALSPKKRTRTQMGVIALVLVTCIGGSMLVLLVAYILYITWSWRKRRAHERLSFLPSIFEPSTYEHIMSPQTGNIVEYNVLDLQKHGEKENVSRVVSKEVVT